MIEKLALTPLITVSFASVLSCAPPIYFIDRHTVMELEAAGEWPDLEKDFLEQNHALGPVPLERVANNQAKSKVYSVLNGEFLRLDSSTSK